MNNYEIQHNMFSLSILTNRKFGAQEFLTETSFSVASQRTSAETLKEKQSSARTP